MSTYKGATLEKYKGELKVQEHQHRDLTKGEVLVKIKSCSIMPADLALLQGVYGSSQPTLPRIFGLEGAGIVESVGEGVNKDIIGKHVGVFANSTSETYHGVWSEYCYVPFENLIVFDEKVDFDVIATAQGNPLTAIGFIETLKSKGQKSVAHTGASSAFGRMFMRLCINEGIEVINIVRKDSSIDELKKYGGKHFINTSKENWDKELKELCDKLDVSILFDCAGGKITGKCLKAIKDYGTIFHFGNLELSRLGDIDPNDFIFGHKKIEGWWMAKFLKSASPEQIEKHRNFIKQDFEKNDGALFKTDFKSSFKLDELEKAFESYLTGSGKILIKP